VPTLRLRQAEQADWGFVVEMAPYAATLEGRPLPDPDDGVVVALLPTSVRAAVIAADPDDNPLGAGWWHVQEPPLVRDGDAAALPELAMAVRETERGRGVGTALVEGVVALVAEQFDALTLNVHLLNPAVRLYVRTGFRVAGPGRGPYGVALQRDLRQH
jgi:GNAT superfamily N-acetyltransferase